jgi:hypothetical protein
MCGWFNLQWVCESGEQSYASKKSAWRDWCAQTGDENDDMFKVVLIGDFGVGKSDPRVTSLAWSPNRQLV